MTRRSLYFAAPRRVEIREDALPAPGRGELVVRTLVSAISAGTELLVYRGEISEGLALDENLRSLEGEFRYPVQYGYACAGEVVGLGPEVAEDWLGRRVFSFQPHASHFLARVEELETVPPDTTPEWAALLPTVETGVNLLLDARPLFGERALVVGQGVVGLVTTALLARFPLERVWSVEPLEPRRRISLRLGAESSFAPDDFPGGDFDLAFELSGAPSALNLAIAAIGYEGRVIAGSWYGDKRAPIDLGTHFHRGRLRLISSQVSRLGTHLLSRWSKKRRLEAAWKALSTLPASDLVSHRYPIERAEEAYRLLDEHPERCLQILLTYT